MTWADEYLQLIEDCEMRESLLTDWQRQFIDSLRRHMEEGRRPSVKQIEKLDEAWEQATSKG